MEKYNSREIDSVNGFDWRGRAVGATGSPELNFGDAVDV